MKAPSTWPALAALVLLLTIGSIPLKQILSHTEPAAIQESFNKAFALRAAPLLFLNHRIAASQFFLLEAILSILKLEFPHYHLAGEHDAHHEHDHPHHEHHPEHHEEEEPVAWTHGPGGEDIPLTRAELEALQERERELTLHTDRYLDIGAFYDRIEVAARLDPENGFILAYGQSWVLNPTMARAMVGVLDAVHADTGYWRPAFDAGWLLLYHLREPEEARARFTAALADSRAPAFVRDILVRSAFADRRYELAIHLLEAQIAATSDHDLATRLERQLQWTRDLFLLNRAALRFRHQKGHPPTRLEDLVASGLVPKIPEDPIGAGYAWDPEREEVYSRSIVRLTGTVEESAQEKTTGTSSR